MPPALEAMALLCIATMAGLHPLHGHTVGEAYAKLDQLRMPASTMCASAPFFSQHADRSQSRFAVSVR